MVQGLVVPHSSHSSITDTPGPSAWPSAPWDWLFGELVTVSTRSKPPPPAPPQATPHSSGTSSQSLSSQRPTHCSAFGTTRYLYAQVPAGRVICPAQLLRLMKPAALVSATGPLGQPGCGGCWPGFG